MDLPGYGYARQSKELRLTWNDFTKAYFLEREQLVNVLLLVDASIPPTRIDLECANWLGDAEVPFTVVFTKADKRKKGAGDAGGNMEAFKRELLKDWAYLPPCVVTSAAQGVGKNQLLSLLAQLRDLANRQRAG